MKKLIEEIKQTVEKEYGRAGASFGLSNNSDHESFAVILEEIEESRDELNMFCEKLTDFWQMVKHNASDNEKYAQLKSMETTAILAACEFVQVCAMCKKAAITVCDRGAVNESLQEMEYENIHRD